MIKRRPTQTALPLYKNGKAGKQSSSSVGYSLAFGSTRFASAEGTPFTYFTIDHPVRSPALLCVAIADDSVVTNRAPVTIRHRPHFHC
jgi:hypothetical protein